MLKRSYFIFLLLMSLAWMSAKAPVYPQQAAKEYQVKAVFLYNFTQFVSWPVTSLEEGSPFIIGIVGTDPFGKYLDEIIKDEKVQGHAIFIRRFSSAEEVEPCHILFINLTDKAVVSTLIEKSKQNKTLTVGDALVVEKQHGIIRFVTNNNKTKLRINVTAAKEAHLTISSKLLNLAEIIN